MYPESTRSISEGLQKCGIDHVLLRGARVVKDRTVARFKSRDRYGEPEGSTDVMVITSSRDCAGLHQPEANRLILYHYHESEAIRKQSISRGQRVKRDYSLEVVELMNEGEVRMHG